VVFHFYLWFRPLASPFPSPPVPVIPTLLTSLATLTFHFFSGNLVLDHYKSPASTFQLSLLHPPHSINSSYPPSNYPSCIFPSSSITCSITLSHLCLSFTQHAIKTQGRRRSGGKEISKDGKKVPTSSFQIRLLPRQARVRVYVDIIVTDPKTYTR
jgi:hypothetical protein